MFKAISLKRTGILKHIALLYSEPNVVQMRFKMKKENAFLHEASMYLHLNIRRRNNGRSLSGKVQTEKKSAENHKNVRLFRTCQVNVFPEAFSPSSSYSSSLPHLIAPPPPALPPSIPHIDIFSTADSPIMECMKTFVTVYKWGI